MRTLVLVALLAAILSFACTVVQLRSRAWLRRRLYLFVVPALLSALFSLLAAGLQAFSIPVALLILTYTLLPTAAAWTLRDRAARPTWLDFAIILALWLPLEFAAGHQWIPRPAQGFLHSVAYGIAILMGLSIFLAFRAMPGMKYCPPRARDLAYGVAGFAIVAPVLIAAGRLINFIPPPHLPARMSLVAIMMRFLAILAGTALPEEILFRSLIQNFLMQRFGFSNRILLVSALIFGAAHLDNGPQPLPNWRYMIVATIAGFAYGKVFEKSSSVFSSITLHALVDVTKHLFF
jgi:uncharacterized protein